MASGPMSVPSPTVVLPSLVDASCHFQGRTPPCPRRRWDGVPVHELAGVVLHDVGDEADLDRLYVVQAAAGGERVLSRVQ
jgi:hypothetical protein